MSRLTTAAILMAGLALSACTNPAHLGGGGGLFGGGNRAGADATDGFGAASDPTSPAYFQETVGDRVFFAVDQSTLSEEARLTLLSQANWLLANPDYAAVIEGHADEQGTREYNLALGARRANAVREFLISQGVPAVRLRSVSYGKERPIEICSAEACYERNRRSVTVISAGFVS